MNGKSGSVWEICKNQITRLGDWMSKTVFRHKHCSEFSETDTVAGAHVVIMDEPFFYSGMERDPSAE